MLLIILSHVHRPQRCFKKLIKQANCRRFSPDLQVQSFVIRDFKIYDATVAKTLRKIASSIFFVIVSLLNF